MAAQEKTKTATKKEKVVAKKEKASGRAASLSQLRAMSADEISVFIDGQKAALLSERFNRVAQKTSKMHAYRFMKRDIARAYTVLNQKSAVKE